jgi:hypothetical protein
VSFHLEPSLKGLPWRTEVAPVPPRFVLTRGKDVSFQWTCSAELSRVLESSISAPAYEIEFANREWELKEGSGRRVVVEGDARGFANDDGPPRSVVSLGHHNCWGWNLKWELSGIAVRVTALLADGSERKFDGIFVLESPRR